MNGSIKNGTILLEEKQRFSDTVQVTNKIHTLFKKYKTLTASDIIHYFGYAKSTVYKAIDELLESGRIKSIGPTLTDARGPRSTIYCDTKFLGFYKRGGHPR